MKLSRIESTSKSTTALQQLAFRVLLVFRILIREMQYLSQNTTLAAGKTYNVLLTAGFGDSA
jgi:hypothetical protein